MNHADRKTAADRILYDSGLLGKLEKIGKAHIIGSYAGEFIVAVSELVDLEVDIENIKKLVFPHPTVCEIVREAVFAI